MGRRVLIMGAALVLTVSGCGGSPGAKHNSSPQPGAINGPIEYLGSGATIVRSAVPGGPAYSIVGQHYRYWNHDYLQLSVHLTEAERTAPGFGSPTTTSEGSISSTAGTEEPIEWSTSSGCEPHGFVIAYGVLKQSDDAVLARIAGRLVPFDRAPLPHSLHYPGELVYSASSRSSLNPVIQTRARRLTQQLLSGGALPVCHAPGNAGARSHRAASPAKLTPEEFMRSFGMSTAEVKRCLRRLRRHEGRPRSPHIVVCK